MDEGESVVGVEHALLRPKVQVSSRRRSNLYKTALYCAVMCINGGVIGAFGPSLECFQRSTGLGQGALGTSVLQNRLAKLVGTVLWAWYATSLHSGKRVRMHSHVALAVSLLLTAMSCAILGFTQSGFKLEAVMVVSGFAYGITDSACAQLTLWVWEDDARWQRGCVAVINACFTVGAFVTPMLVAGSLHYLNDAVWPAFHILAALSLVSAIVATRLPPPRPGRRGHDKSETDAHAEVDASSEGARERRRVLLFLSCISTIGFFANGCEHAVATWLSSYGVHMAGLAEEKMAIMTSNFWTAMSAGRLGWALCSSLVPSAYPVLLVNALCCLGATLLFSQANESTLLIGALGSGIGVSSSFPALMTLGPEARIEMTPRRMATLQLSASAGEMLCPFFLGLCFQFRLYHWFGPLSFVQQCASFVALAVAYSGTRLPKHAAHRHAAGHRDGADGA